MLHLNSVMRQTSASFNEFAEAVHEQTDDAIDYPTIRMFWGLTAINAAAGTYLLNKLCNEAPQLADRLARYFAAPPARADAPPPAQADAPGEALYEQPPAIFVANAGTAYVVANPQAPAGAAAGTQDEGATPRRSEDRRGTMLVAPSVRPDLSTLTVWRLREPAASSPADNPREASA